MRRKKPKTSMGAPPGDVSLSTKTCSRKHRIENCQRRSLRQAALSNCAQKDNRSKPFFDSSPTTNASGSSVIIAAVGAPARAPLALPSTVVVNLTPHRLFRLALTLLCVSFSPVCSQTGSNLSSTPLGNESDSFGSSHPIITTTGASAPALSAVTVVGKPANHDPMWVHRLIFASLNGLLFLLGLANVLVLFIVSRYRRMRTVTNILIFNLCLADLIYISFLPVVIMFQLLRDWMFGIVACKLFYITESTAKYASVYFVGVLCLDRYFALCHPQVCKRYRRPSLALLVSVIGWFVTAVLMTPIYLYSTVVGREGERFCTVAWPPSENQDTPTGPADPESSLYPDSSYLFWNDTSVETEKTNFAFAMLSNVSEELCADPVNDTCHGPSHSAPHAAPSAQFYFITLTFVFCFGIPALVILFFYFKVLDQLFQASDRAERLKKRREKTYRKVTRMVLAVISFYLICWLPYWIQFLVVTFAAFSLNNALKIFFNSIHLLPYLNCAMNPILYSLMTDNFRRILGELFPVSGRSLFPCRRGRQKSAKSSSQRAQAIALLDQATSPYHPPGGDGHMHDEKGGLLHTNGETTFTSLNASISPSIRMVSDFSVNLLMARVTSTDAAGSPSAASINSQ